jgi:hypothetical protein
MDHLVLKIASTKFSRLDTFKRTGQADVLMDADRKNAER